MLCPELEKKVKRGSSAIELLDLTDIKRKLVQPEPHGYGWTQAQADEGEVWYKRYLTTILYNPESAGCVPNVAIDKFWHAHILDTEKYAQDCATIFGHFLHHRQYMGMNGDGKLRDNLFVETNRMYRELFGEDCSAMKHFERDAVVAMCEGTSCVGSGCRHHESPQREVPT
ncbi:hypothetical protein EB052_00600 [bacterium]|nr:hypothetical protein [bacterium]